jgi:hypothetical protein
VHVLLPLSLAACLWVGDDDLGDRQDSDQDGYAVGDDCDAAAGGCAPPSGGLPDLAVGSRYDSLGGSWNGAVHVLDGTLRGNAKVPAASHVFVAGSQDDMLVGESIAGDGIHDFALGLGSADLGGKDNGAVYAWSGFTSGQTSLDAADRVLTGEADDSQAGSNIAAAGDVDGDGRADVVVSAPHASSWDLVRTTARGSSWAWRAGTMAPTTGPLRCRATPTARGLGSPVPLAAT